MEFYVYFGGPKGSSNIQFALFCGSDSTLQTNSNDGAKFWGASETQMVWNEAGWYKVQIPLAGTTIAHNNIALGGVFHASAAFNYDILIYGARVLTDDTVTEFTMTKTALTSVANDLRSIEADGLTVTEGMVTVEKINSKPAASTLTGDSFKMVYEGGTGSSKVVYTFDNPIDLTNYKDGDIYVEFWIYKQSAFKKQQAPNPETEEIAINNLGIYFNRGNGSFYAHELSHKYEAPDGPQTEFDLIETGEWTHMIMEIKRGPFGGAGTDGENELTSMEFRFDAVDDNDIVAIQGMRFYIKPATTTFEHVGTLNYKKLETEAVNTTVAISDEVAAEAKVNDKVTLKADLSNDILGQANVEWSVNDTELAQIRSGKITYLKAGTVEITAKIGDSTDTKSVTVTTVPVTQITVTAPSGHSTAVGTTFKLTASVAPENATDASVTWSSSDAAKATIDAATGEVTLVAAGEVTFTATAKDGSGVTGTYKVTVTEYISATGITLDKTTASGKVGDTVTLTATVTPSNSDDVVEWSTSDASVATVENGVVTFHKAGTVTITAKAGDKTATCAVTVNAEEDNGGNGGDTEKGGLSTGAIIGIVAACVVVVGGGLAAFFLTRKKNA